MAAEGGCLTTLHVIRCLRCTGCRLVHGVLNQSASLQAGGSHLQQRVPSATRTGGQIGTSTGGDQLAEGAYGDWSPVLDAQTSGLSGEDARTLMSESDGLWVAVEAEGDGANTSVAATSGDALLFSSAGSTFASGLGGRSAAATGPALMMRGPLMALGSSNRRGGGQVTDLVASVNITLPSFHLNSSSLGTSSLVSPALRYNSEGIAMPSSHSAACGIDKGLSEASGSDWHISRQAATANSRGFMASLGGDGNKESIAIDEYDISCGVCFDDKGDFLALRPCSHKLCVACATELVKLHPCDPVPCPFCRAFIRGFEALHSLGTIL